MPSNPLLSTHTLPPFSAIEPEHIEPAVRAVLDENRRRLAEVLAQANGEPTKFSSAIVPLEQLAERLHRVWAPVVHLHGVANSPALREAYNACLPELSRYQTEIAQNEALHALYKKVADARPTTGNGAEASVLQHALRDFRLGGVDLPPEAKRQFQAAMEELMQLQATFEQNVLDSMAAWQLPITDEHELAGLPDTAIEQAASNAADAGQAGWLLLLDQPTYVAVMTHADNRDLRHRVYRAWATRASDQPAEAGGDAGEFDNTGVIERILELRHTVARLVGFENYAQYSLATKMAASVDEVRSFLEDLAERTRPAARDELEELERHAGTALAAWDIAYYAERLRREKYAISDELLRPYFPLDRVLAGLFEVAGRLYGISVEWVEGVETWHPDVRYYRFCDDHGVEIGGVYTDLFARANKRSGAWMDECVIRTQLGTETQIPVAHLVCNFAAPTTSTPSLLTHNDVVTLFHEFGHTLHHVLTRIVYPSVSGVNGVPWDAVELPSQFMENYAWHPDVVRTIAGHYETGAPLPEEWLERLRASRVFHAGLQMARQLEFALYDLRLHAEPGHATADAILALLDEVRAEVAVVRQPEFNRFMHSFTHIFGGGYAAGYYSYKWAEVLAADAWSAFEEHGIFDADTAARFRRGILEIGGTRDIGAAFAEFRGRAPSIAPLLAQAGIADADAA